LIIGGKAESLMRDSLVRFSVFRLAETWRAESPYSARADNALASCAHPQRTAPQANGSNPPALRPPSMSGHMTPEVRADTAKLTPELRASILKAADAK
jgi:hypothetical protein